MGRLAESLPDRPFGPLRPQIQKKAAQRLVFLPDVPIIGTAEIVSACRLRLLAGGFFHACPANKRFGPTVRVTYGRMDEERADKGRGSGG